MQLNVRETAQFLNVSEKTIYRWIKEGLLPAYRIHEQYRFNRAELLEWATAQKINVSAELFEDPDGAPSAPANLAEALRRGGIFYRLGGHDKPSVLQNLVDLMPLPEGSDRTLLFQVLMARENLASTAIGDGIAIPHVRNPIILHVTHPLVTLCFLERPIAFGAPDGKPVCALFSLVCPTVRAHLQHLSRLAFALKDPAFKSMITREGAREDILAEVARIDAGVFQSNGKP